MDRSDVFISYRRADVEFTKQLYQALKDAGRELWVDWEDIPPGVEGFSDEIQRGIEGADAFIAILSPSYLQSEYCLMELREALKLKKRVIPVVLKKFEPAPAPDGIGHINWVYFTPHAGQANTFEQSFPKVVEALEADYDHVREHTRLLLRAIDWEKRQRENSYLMKGVEIDAAERWHVTAASKNPTPTELQGEYILTSRKQQRKQQQQIMVAIGFLLVIALIAAGFAVFQANEANIAKSSAEGERNNARTQEAVAVTAQYDALNQQATAEAAKIEADEQRVIAEGEAEKARISSVAAQSQLVQSRQLGVLLALEAYNLSHERNEVNPAVQTSLRNVLLDFGGLPVHSYQGDAIFVNYSPDGQWLVSMGSSGRAQLSRVNNGEVAEPIDVAETGYLSNIVFSPDNKWLAGLYSDDQGSNQIRLWSLSDPKAAPANLRPLEGTTASITTFAFSDPQSKQYWLAAGLDDGSVYYWDASNLPESEPVFLKQDKNADPAALLTFSPDGRWLAVGFGQPYSVQAASLLIWNMKATQSEPFALDLNQASLRKILFSRKGKWLAASTGSAVKLWNMDVVGSNPTPTSLEFYGDVLAFSPDERWLVAFGGSDGKVWSLQNLSNALNVPGYRDIVMDVTFSPDSRWLATGDFDGNLRLWKTQDFSPGPLKNEMAQLFNGFDVIVRSLKFNAAGTQLVAAGDQQVRVWDFPVSQAEPAKLNGTNENLYSVKNWLLVRTDPDSLVAIDLRQTHPKAEISARHATEIAYQLTSDEHYLAVTSDKQIQIWDLNQPATILFDPPALQTGEGNYTSPIFTSDENWLVYAISNQIYAVDLRNPGAPLSLEGNRKVFPITELWSYGKWLISQSDGETLAWDLSQPVPPPQQLGDLRGNLEVYTDNAETPRWLMIVKDAVLNVWDLTDLSQPVFVQDQLGFDIWPDIINSRWLLTQFSDGEYFLWDLTDLQQPIARFYAPTISDKFTAFAFTDDEGALQAIRLSADEARFIPLGKTSEVGNLIFSPDGQWLAGAVYSQQDNTYSTILYDLANPGAPIKLAKLSFTKFSPAGHWLVLYDDQSNTVLYDLIKRAVLPTSYPASGSDVAFSPNERWTSLVLQENNATNALLVDLSNPDQTYKLTGHTDVMLGLFFTPDNKALMTSNYDGTIRIWNLDHPQNDPVVLKHAAPIYGNLFSLTSDGQWLLVQAERLYIWRMNFAEVAQTACELIGRNLTSAEWEKYLGQVAYGRTCKNWPEGALAMP